MGDGMTETERVESARRALGNALTRMVEAEGWIADAVKLLMDVSPEWAYDVVQLKYQLDELGIRVLEASKQK